MNLRTISFPKLPSRFCGQLTLICLLSQQTLTLCHAAGSVVAWGDNNVLQSQVPPGLTNGVGVAAGFLHSVALKSDGTVISWGYNFSGQTNTPAGLTNATAIAAGYSSSVALKSDGKVVSWGTPSAPASLSNVIAIASGWDHGLALKADGSLVAWGSQTTVPGGLTNLIAISAGNGYSLGLRLDGTVVAWGDNAYGKTNVPAGLANVAAIAAGGDHSLALKRDGTVAAWGGNYNGQASVPAGLSNVVAIAAGALHSLALKADGTLAAWGDNSHGQTGIVPGQAGFFGISAGGYHSLGLRGDSSPVIVLQPLSQRGFTGKDISFQVMAVGAQPLTYQWQHNGTNIAGATNATFIAKNVQTNDAGSYIAVAGNISGSVSSAPAILTVVSSPPFILAQPQDQTAVCGDVALLQINADGTRPLNYQWFFEGGLLAGATRSSLALSNVVTTQAGRYSVRVSNVYATLTSSVARLTVTVEPPFITSPLFASGKQGQPFLYTITGLHSPTGYGAAFLLPNLFIDTSSGTISGIPLESGTFGPFISTVNSCATDVRQLILTIASSAPVITSGLFASGTEEAPFTNRIMATESPTSFGADGLPLGLTVNATNGLILGKSVYAGEFDTTVWASNRWGVGSANLHLSFANERISGLSIANVSFVYSSPYLLDFQFSLRDNNDPTQGSALVVAPSLLSVTCKEDDVPISTLETGQIVERGSIKVMKAYLVLDFTESIASLVNGDVNGDGISDAVDNMVSGAQEFVNQQAPDAQIGVYEFHREDVPPQKVIDLTTDKALVKQAVAGIWTNYVQGFPAGSRCWDALVAAIGALGPAKADEQHFVIFVSDGRDESSSSTVTNVITAATNNKVKIYCIGFGSDLDAATLQLITSQTQGRYYTAANPTDLAANFAEIGKDLNGQYLLRWATLKRSAKAFAPSFEISYQGFTALSPLNPVTVMIDTNTMPPTTNYSTNVIIGPYIPPQHTGNVTVGILRLVANAEALPKSVTLRAFYVPRYIRQLRVNYRANWPSVATLQSAQPGELLDGWSMTESDDGAGGKWLNLLSPSPQNITNSLPFAALGNLVKFSLRDMTDATNAFSVLAVDNTIYTNTGGQSFIFENATNFITSYPVLPYGTPVPWLIANGFSGNFIAAEVSDPDNDGILTWQEYRANTDPRDPNSKFVIRRLQQRIDGFYQITFSTSLNRIYRVDSSTDLLNWTVVQDNVAGTGANVTVIDVNFLPGTPEVFYRIAVY